MEADNALVGALIFVILILGANFLMYAIARGWAKDGKSGDVRWIDSLKQGLTKPMESQRSRDVEELHQKVEELTKGEKEQK